MSFPLLAGERYHAFVFAAMSDDTNMPRAYATFWARLAAGFIDFALVLIISVAFLRVYRW